MKQKALEEFDPESTPALGEVLEFMRLIWQLDHGLQQASKRMEKSLGVTGPQRLVLRILGRFPGMPAGYLAGLLHLHPSTLTGVLERLERKGLIRRRADPRDGRRLLLGLTDRGRLFDVETEGSIEASVHQTLRRIPEHKLRAAREVLKSIAEALSETGASAAAPHKRRPKRDRG